MISVGVADFVYLFWVFLFSNTKGDVLVCILLTFLEEKNKCKDAQKSVLMIVEVWVIFIIFLSVMHN